MARRYFYGMGEKKSPFKDDKIFDLGPQTKIDALVRKYTGFRSLTEMASMESPTLRVPPGATKETKKHFALLRKAYKRVTGKDAAR